LQTLNDESTIAALGGKSVTSQAKTCLILTFLILATHAHCVASHAAELAVKIEASNFEAFGDGTAPLSGAAPLGSDGLPCEEGPGCLCQGALLSDLSMAVVDQDNLALWLSCANLTMGPDSPISIGLANISRPFSVPIAHIGGVSARALLQSFQI
jgi:hypothetical protein